MSKHPALVLLDSLNNALLYALETATCLAVFYLLYHFVLRKESSFQYNRFYLLAAILISLSFPLLKVGYNPENTPSVLNSLHNVSNEVSKEPIIEPKGYYSVTVTANSCIHDWDDRLSLKVIYPDEVVQGFSLVQKAQYSI